MSTDNLLDLDNSNAELYRRQLLASAEENRILRHNVKELQEQLQNAYNRIDELVSEK